MDQNISQTLEKITTGWYIVDIIFRLRYGNDIKTYPEKWATEHWGYREVIKKKNKVSIFIILLHQQQLF